MTFSISISGPNPEMFKERIKREALARQQSISQFVLECIQIVMEARKADGDKKQA